METNEEKLEYTKRRFAEQYTAIDNKLGRANKECDLTSTELFRISTLEMVIITIEKLTKIEKQ